MKRISGSTKLSVWMLLFGMVALILRKTLYVTAVDVKGLLLRNQPLEIALMVLTIGVLLRLALHIRKLTSSGGYGHQASPNLIGAVGNIGAGAGILMTVLAGQPFMGGNLEIVWYWLGLAAPVCLLVAGIARLFGKKPFFLLYVVVCLFFLMHIVRHYQLWSSNPQLQDYLFAMLGAMGLMLFGFYTAAGEADCGNPPIRLGMGLAAIYLCLAELARSSCPWLYLGGIFWVLTDFFRMPRTQQD